MAVFHLTTKPISRKSGRTATAAAAYRAAALIQCEYTGLTHDYRNKRGVDYTECVLVDQDGNPTFLDREQLWNAAELSEKRKDARTAREIIVALPHELDAEGRKFAARAFGGRLSQLYGVAVDVCIHQPDKDGDERNYHAHIMMTTRKVSVENGRAVLGEKSDLELSDRELRKRYGSDASGRKFINEIRKRWADGVNSILESKGIDARIDHRSHAARGLQELPTIKMGVAATAMERRGEISERGEINRAIKAANAQYREIQNEIAQAQQAQADERDRITRNIAITDRAIESTDRAINATDQDAERRKRSIEQRKRAAATTHIAAGAGQQHTATATDSAAGTHNEVAADDQRAAATRSAADRSIDSAEQHINAAEQHINAAAQDIAAYDRDAERTSGYIQQLNEIDQIEIQPVAHAPKPAEPAPPPPPPPQHEINNIRDGWHEYTEEHAMHNAFSPRYKGNPLANEMKELELKKQCGMGQDEYEKQKKLLDTVASMNADKVNRNQHKYSADEYQQRIKTASILTDAPAPAPEPKPPAPEPKPEPANTARDDDFDFSL